MTTPAETIAPTADLKPKSKLKGKIAKITLAGAVVDLGMDLPGIVHISQIAATPVKRVEDIVQEGQEVDVWVRRVKADRVELTMVEPLALEWKEIKAEMALKGKVVRLESYGAFVEIGAERPGLVHISEMSHGYVKTPQDVVQEGEEVDVVVLDVDRKKRQIRLSMKAAQPKPEVEQPPQEVPNPERKRRKKGKAKAERIEINEPDSEPELTAFEIAWKAALERQQAEKSRKTKKSKVSADQRDEILDRTLKNRMPTGG